MDKYKENVRAVNNHMRANGNSDYVIGVYAKCFNDFGDYLRDTRATYSPTASQEWLEAASARLGRTRYALYSAALRKLNDVYESVEIKKSHYDPQKRQWGNLSVDFRNAIMRVLVKEAGNSETTRNNVKERCCSILCLLEKRGGQELPLYIETGCLSNRSRLSLAIPSLEPRGPITHSLQQSR